MHVTVNDKWHFRARSYQAHLSLQYAHQLRQFVDTYAANEPPHAGETGVFIGGRRTRIFRNIDLHTAELPEHELPAMPPDPVLTEESRARRINLDQNSYQSKSR